jgi:hypothetical protein
MNVLIMSESSSRDLAFKYVELSFSIMSCIFFVRIRIDDGTKYRKYLNGALEVLEHLAYQHIIDIFKQPTSIQEIHHEEAFYMADRLVSILFFLNVPADVS